ncbi:MAG: arginine biosynthesis bifunctional protein ArgJ [Gemmatales bacterium]|nr:MAG: arginine biosynthesis bifunctional protein ArgJ [Gemmatales bacterium]
MHLPNHFRFAGLHCGIKPSTKSDLALVVSDLPAAGAGVFTQNRVRAAPVRLTEQRLPASDIRGLVVCSGNANACTGEPGWRDAVRMAEIAADKLGCRPDQILVCSTGVIGQRLPMEKIEAGIDLAAKNLASDRQSFAAAASAILTTDTRAKISSRIISFAGSEIRLTGFAKGAAMIGPNMATMLAFVLADSAVPCQHLQNLARQAAQETFNCVRVEGHTSTNDSLILLANGAGPPLPNEGLKEFDAAVTAICADLAREIAADAEGASHLVTIRVTGLPSKEEARRVAIAVADSPLVKTAIFGADPNWGRIVSAAGYAGVDFEEKNLSLRLGDFELYKTGTPARFSQEDASAYLKNNREIDLHLSFDLGTETATVWTCDLTYEYVRLNAEYTT